jgi:predicted ester cyclase
MVGEGDRLAYSITGSGTFTGKLRAVDIKAKKITWKQAILATFKDGKVAAAVSFTDPLALYQQLGVTPPAAPPGR